jgi:caffeoyl-CoA O-methyltransferase
MTDIISIAADEYSKQFSSPLDPISMENELYTMANHHMHSGHVQGKFLEMLSFLIQPKRILEIGTFTGFSALCLSKGLHPDGHLHTIEIREEDAGIAQDFFERAGLKNKITVHVGDALTIIPQLEEQWDMVYIDADKVSYIEYYQLTLPLVKKGGFIIADNVLFHGHVFEDEIKGKNAKAIHDFNQYVASDVNVQQVVLTVRDGLSLIRKL